MAEWAFEVVQSGEIVASGDAGDEETARREAMHYAMMYVQDGPEVHARWFERDGPLEKLRTKTHD